MVFFFTEGFIKTASLKFVVGNFGDSIYYGNDKFEKKVINLSPLAACWINKLNSLILFIRKNPAFSEFTDIKKFVCSRKWLGSWHPLLLPRCLQSWDFLILILILSWFFIFILNWKKNHDNRFGISSFEIFVCLQRWIKTVYVAGRYLLLKSLRIWRIYWNNF